MEEFKTFELLTEQIRPKAADGESTFEPTMHATTRAASAESLHSFKWQPSLGEGGGSFPIHTLIRNSNVDPICCSIPYVL